jgi:pimeloyl-ACP methyl ester carboxylesterase
MDRRGRGGSGDGPVYAVEREAEDVAAVIEAVGEPVFLLGHSYGAIASLEASRLTPHVRRLVLYEPPIPVGAAVYPPGVPERIQALVDAGDLEAGLEVFFREVVRMPDPEFEVFRTLPAWEGRVRLAPTIPRELTIERGLPLPAGAVLGLQHSDAPVAGRGEPGRVPSSSQPARSRPRRQSDRGDARPAARGDGYGAGPVPRGSDQVLRLLAATAPQPWPHAVSCRR